MADLARLFPQEFWDEVDLLSSMVARRRRSQSLPELLQLWSSYASMLARNEQIHLDDYSPMLFARDLIQEIIDVASLRTRHILEALISLDDSLFLFGTQRDDGEIIKQSYLHPGTGWWWSRVPKSLVL
jgi:hypothetical protein